MRITCPHCHAEELRCPEVLPGCRAAGLARRQLYASANGNVEAVLRAHDEAIRARVFDYGYSYQDHRPKPPAPGRLTEIP